jgi:hypothetical protein
MKTIRAHKCLAVIGMFSFLVTTAPGASVLWDGSESTDWSNGDNWSTSSPPGIGDVARIEGTPANQPVISTNAGSIDFLSMTNSDGVSSSLEVTTGGTLNVNTGAATVVLGTSADSTINITGGTMTSTGQFYVGYSSFKGTLNISDGSVTADRWLIPSINTGHDLAVGEVNITGGIMYAGRLGDAYAAAPQNRLVLHSDSRVGNIDISGTGKLLLYGDWETSGSTQYTNLNSWITNGWLTYDGSSNFDIDYDSVSGYTTVVPEPSTFVLVALAAIGALASRRRR